jgi:hypothetical protein
MHKIFSVRKPILFVLLIFTWYGLGAAYVESFVNYPSWFYIPSENFLFYHQFLAKRITIFLVLPLLVKVLVTCIVWLKFKEFRSKLRWILILQGIFWISSLFVQIPIQSRLDSIGKELPDIELLILTDWWMRTIPHSIEALLLSFWVYQWLTTTTVDVPPSD